MNFIDITFAVLLAPLAFIVGIALAAHVTKQFFPNTYNMIFGKKPPPSL